MGSFADDLVRLAGGGGATEIASLAKRIVWLLDEHSPQRLVEQVSFITDVSTHDFAIITPLCILRADSETNEACLVAIHPNIKVEDVKQKTGWELEIIEDIRSQLETTRTALSMAITMIQKYCQ
jgi:glutaconate CoA-transferase subunit B